ncbi:heat shock protein DnaJ domain protein [[Leptolyngbya] sp. PCC 7376]|uniref:J domain-containing protein n=1 Tax=[Leptolyngbya] sp. PCC 7376 TaxID=111781 RepID=UPI00029EF9A1|nr:J domain-containing protein [[Leptolyngbya] sp. PCC 7376]AFY39450.1 heat shock protein DnaJ domain protein [[Leptolyngbya] sp. PCC 7376]
MPSIPDHYRTLNISPRATQQEIKIAYRKLAKQFHPDVCETTAQQGKERIVEINQAYEVLGDEQHRRQYDHDRNAVMFRGIRSAQGVNVKPRRSTEVDLEVWLKKIYRPLNRTINAVIDPLEEQIEDLSADPFDDELMQVFMDYLEESKESVEQAQKIFQSLPNPANVARIARDLYYCLNHLSDGLEQFEWFTLNYSEDYLYTGQEMFHRAYQFSRQVRQAIAELG